jgi:hypothetical protein
MKLVTNIVPLEDTTLPYVSFSEGLKEVTHYPVNQMMQFLFPSGIFVHIVAR